MTKPLMLKEVLVYENRFAQFFDDEIQQPDGTLGRHIRFTYRGNIPGAVIIPLLPDGRLLLLEINRYAVNEPSLEFPRGGGHFGETSEQTANRELSAETKVMPIRWTLIGYHRPDTSIVMTETAVFVAEIAAESESIFEPNRNEGIVAGRFLPEKEIWKMVASHRIRDGFTLGALACLRAHEIVHQAAD